MKKLATVLFLVSFVSLLPGQKTRLGQEPPKAKPGVKYPIKIHVSGIHLRSHCSASEVRYAMCEDVLYADATVDGRKIELMGNLTFLPGFRQVDLVPGDYGARLLKAAPKTSTTPLDQEYELELSSKTVWRRTVTGFSE